MRFNPDEYITVSERIEKFYAKFPQGRILTSIVEHNAETGFILIRAEVYREPEDALPAATGHAYELRSAGHVQAGSYVEVCETSSVGRALALLGFEVRRGVASREEVIRGAKKQQAAVPAAPAPAASAPAATPAPRPERASAPSAGPAAPAAPPPAPTPAAETSDLDTQILQAAEELGYDAAKVRKWVNQKFDVTGGLGSLTPHDKREVLKIFTEQARSPRPRAARK
jgi:pyruvate/2-oxoglutarate dehydrogenase complex dihydrolipoamide acyltransferase (E2) component